MSIAWAFSSLRAMFASVLLSGCSLSRSLLPSFAYLSLWRSERKPFAAAAVTHSQVILAQCYRLIVSRSLCLRLFPLLLLPANPAGVTEVTTKLY